jgi:hypothetical protein
MKMLTIIEVTAPYNSEDAGGDVEKTYGPYANEFVAARHLERSGWAKNYSASKFWYKNKFGTSIRAEVKSQAFLTAITELP